MCDRRIPTFADLVIASVTLGNVIPRHIVTKHHYGEKKNIANKNYDVTIEDVLCLYGVPIHG